MNVKFMVVPLFFGFMVSAMEKQEKKIKTVRDVGSYCVQLTEEALNQPALSIDGKWYKVLSLNNWDVCRICTIIANNAAMLKKWDNPWSMRYFIDGNSSVKEVVTHELIGIEIEMHTAREDFSFKALKENYAVVIALLQKGWKEARIEEHKDLFHKRDLNVWNFFTKKKVLHREDILVQLLTYKFNLNDYKEHDPDNNVVDCFDYGRSDEMLYLWVKKDKQAAFDRIFGFRYE